jgi:DHA1 family multidrug resistance protein-like MFS transporter
MAEDTHSANTGRAHAAAHTQPGASGISARVAVATALTSVAMCMWAPFLPLLMLGLGAKDQADAVSWAAIGLTSQGVTSLASGPVWGLLSDRYGRKLMFVRSLAATSITSLIIGFAHAPWHAAAGLAVLGLLGGYVQSGSALVSVMVPDAELKRGLARVQGALYLGSTMGPALGAALAAVLPFRGVIFASAVATAAVAVWAAYIVPADRPRLGHGPAGRTALEPLNASPQLAFSLLLYFFLFALNQLVGLATPIALNNLSGDARSFGASGVAFTLGGLASAIGVFFISTRFFRSGTLAGSLALAALVIAAAHVLLAYSGTQWLYTTAFVVISLLEAAMLPVTSTLMAMNVPQSRRGTAFGLATSTRAIALSAGPAGAALLTATSLRLGLLAIAVLFIALALAIRLLLREKAAGTPLAVGKPRVSGYESRGT